MAEKLEGLKAYVYAMELSKKKLISLEDLIPLSGLKQALKTTSLAKGKGGRMEQRTVSLYKISIRSDSYLFKCVDISCLSEWTCEMEEL